MSSMPVQGSACRVPVLLVFCTVSSPWSSKLRPGNWIMYFPYIPKKGEHYEKASQVLSGNTFPVQNVSAFNTPELPLTGQNATESCSHFTAGISVLKNASIDDTFE